MAMPVCSSFEPCGLITCRAILTMTAAATIDDLQLYTDFLFFNMSLYTL